MAFAKVSESVFSTPLNELSLDHPKRLAYLKSPWRAFWNHKESEFLNQTIEQRVIELFQHRYGYQSAFSFKKVWNQIGSKVWTPAQPLTTGTLNTIDAAFRSQLVYHGPGMTAPLERSPTIDSRVQNLIRILMHGGQLSHDIWHQKTFQAVLVQKNKQLLKDFRLEMQRELDHLASHPPQNPQEEVVWRAFLGNLIALLPFSYPDHDAETLTIPLLKEGVCRRVEYRIEVMPLSLTKYASPMTVLGLVPMHPEEKAPAMLAFLGTTYPAGDGFASTLLADFTPGHSVGEFVYYQNQPVIDQWMKDKKEVHVLGVSLGGAMAFHTLKHHHQKLSRIDVYNPPGPYSWNKDEVSDKCDINIYCQPGDLVSKLGFWPEGTQVHLYHVMQHQGVVENMISSHALAFTGCEKVSILKLNPTHENRSIFRKFLTRLHRFLGPIFVFMPIYLALLLYNFFASIKQLAEHQLKKCYLQLKKLSRYRHVSSNFKV